MQVREPERRRPMLEPMLPLINVVFLLLVFFMVAGQLGQKPPVVVEAPETDREAAPMAEVPKLSIDGQGRLYLGEKQLPVERLREQGASLLSGPEPRLHADARVTTKQLRPVLQALREAGFKFVKLITRRSSP